MTISPRKVRHVSPRQDVCLSLTGNYLHIDIPDQNLKKVQISVSRYITCSVLVKFSPCLVTTGWERKQEIQRARARRRTRGRLNSRLED